MEIEVTKLFVLFIQTYPNTSDRFTITLVHAIDEQLDPLTPILSGSIIAN